MELSLLNQGKLSLSRLGRKASILNRTVVVEGRRAVLEAVRGVLSEFRHVTGMVASVGRSAELFREIHGEAGLNALIASELQRSKQSGQIFEVLLVSLSSFDRSPRFIDKQVANHLFAALGVSLRQTDYFGWYRERLSVGAVLTGLGDNAQAGESGLIEERLVAALRMSLLPADFEQIQLRRWKPHEFDREQYVEISRA